MTSKAGMFANFVSERFSNLNSSGVTSGFPPGFLPITRGKVATEVAGVVDFSAIATYHINANFSFRGGYQLLYLAGVALASQQLSRLQPRRRRVHARAVGRLGILALRAAGVTAS